MQMQYCKQYRASEMQSHAMFTLNGFWLPGSKPYRCENGFPSFKTQILCLQYEASFLSSSQAKNCASL